MDVDYAILEPNGDLSVLKKQEKDSVTKSDMSIAPVQRQYVPTAIIIDGKLIAKNLEEIGLTVEWLNETLSNLNVNNIKDVLYAEIQEDGKLHVQVM